MRWIYMMTKMRRMSHGRNRDFSERNGSRSFLGALTVIVITLVMAKRK